MEQKSLDGSGFARLDIYELQRVLNTNFVQYWPTNYEPLTRKPLNISSKIEIVPKLTELA